MPIDNIRKQYVEVTTTSSSYIALTFTLANSIGTWQIFPDQYLRGVEDFPKCKNGEI